MRTHTQTDTDTHTDTHTLMYRGLLNHLTIYFYLMVTQIVAYSKHCPLPFNFAGLDTRLADNTCVSCVVALMHLIQEALFLIGIFLLLA